MPRARERAEPLLATAAGGRPVVLFDGVCNLCGGWVRFAIARDPGARLRFAPIQSPLGQGFLRRHELPLDQFESFYLIEDGQVFEKSTAFFRMARHLRRPWPLLAAGRLVPRPVRDWFYDRIARNRYRLFGKRERCLVPTPDIADRFLS